MKRYYKKKIISETFSGEKKDKMDGDPRNYFDRFDTFFDPDKFFEFNKQSRNIYENNYAATTSRMTGTIALQTLYYNQRTGQLQIIRFSLKIK